MPISQLIYCGQAVTNDFIYKMLFNYKGYGNPGGKYWFIGMEEHWESSCVNDVTKIVSLKDLEYYHSNPSFQNSTVKRQFFERARKTTTFESGVKRLLEQLDLQDMEQSLATDVFITNVRFMPFTETQKITELFPIRINDYIRDEQKYRKDLFDLWKEREHLTFCLSARYRDYFREIFSNNEKKEFSFKKLDDKTELYIGSIGSNKIFQLYHPSSRGFNSYLTKVIPFIKGGLAAR